MVMAMVYTAVPVVVGGKSSSPPELVGSYLSRFSVKSLSRRMACKGMTKCCLDKGIARKPEFRQILSGVAASIVLLSQTNLAVAENLSQNNNVCQIAGAMDNYPTLPLEQDENSANMMMTMMMKGMTAKNFDPERYSGRWYEVASLKRGFAGAGQEDCHCTQGVYMLDKKAGAIQVDTFCVHGGPDGYITGIRGRVQCLPESMDELEMKEMNPDGTDMIKGKCFLRFPTLPFIPKEPYDVLATDYDNFALVSGAKDTSFVQIYSRTPNPGPEFIAKYKEYLGTFGYDPSKIKDTPQDCEGMTDSKLAAMMSMPGMQQALTNQFPDLELTSAVQFDPLTSVFDTLKKLVQLYFK